MSLTEYLNKDTHSHTNHTPDNVLDTDTGQFCCIYNNTFLLQYILDKTAINVVAEVNNLFPILVAFFYHILRLSKKVV